jgi:hypothetical protein
VTKRRFDAVTAMAAVATLIGVTAVLPTKAAEPLEGLSVEQVRAIMEELRLVRAQFAFIRRVILTPSCLVSAPQSRTYQVTDLGPMDGSAR